MSKRKRPSQEPEDPASLSLKVGEIPAHPFLNKAFKVTVALLDRLAQPQLGQPVALNVQLCYEDGSPVPSADPITLHPARPSINSATGTAAVNVSIKELSADHSTKDAPYRRFRLRVSTPDAAKIQAAMSNTICTVSYQLKVTKNVPDCWYKDEGGRDNGMDVSVLLVDARGGPARLQKNLPLKASLRYDGDVEVRNQSILKIDHTPAPEKSFFVDRNGQVGLRFRIEEVSKNHQKQPFCVRIEPNLKLDDSRLMRSIASTVTGSVVVKSKKSKRARKSTAPKVERALQMPRFGRASTRTRELTSDAVDSDTLQTLTGTESRFITACHGVISWCQFVVKQLGEMEWQHIGYEINEYNQTLDPNRPIFRCPGCFQYKSSLRPVNHARDCPVNTAINTYGNSVKGHLLGLQISAAKYQNSSGEPDLHMSAHAPRSTARSLDVGRVETKHSPIGDLAAPRPLRQVTDDGFRFPEDKGVAPPLFMRGLSDAVTTENDFTKMMQGDQAYFAGDVPFQNTGESKVHAIVMQTSVHGFPAFTEGTDKEEPKLCGFYQYNEGMGNLIFAPKAACEGRAGPDSMKDIEASWQKYKSAGVVIDKTHCVTLGQLKEEALLKHFQNEANDFIS